MSSANRRLIITDENIPASITRDSELVTGLNTRQNLSARLNEIVDLFSSAPNLSEIRKAATGDSLEYAVPASGGVSNHPGFIAGRYYYPEGSTITNQAVSTGQTHYTIFWVPSTRTFDRIAMRVISATAGASVRLAIYSFDITLGRPTALIIDAGEASIATGGAKEIIINTTLAAGFYALAGALSANSSGCSCINQSVFLHQFGDTNFSASNPSGFRVSAAYGAFPANAPATGYSTSNNQLAIALRAA